MTPSSVKSLPGSRSHNQWLVLIALFKFAEALLFVAIGIGAHRLLKKNLADELQTLADHLRHFNPESHVINFILVKASLVNAHMLRRIGFVAFCYAALGSAEGIGLYLEKAWGEYLTLIITASFLPWEIFEIVHRITWIKVGLLTINVLVFVYLLKIVFERGRHGFRKR
jgi:uncharacterized membrane protein (DUF2068 family)